MKNLTCHYCKYSRWLYIAEGNGGYASINKWEWCEKHKKPHQTKNHCKEFEELELPF